MQLTKSKWRNDPLKCYFCFHRLGCPSSDFTIIPWHPGIPENSNEPETQIWESQTKKGWFLNQYVFDSFNNLRKVSWGEDTSYTRISSSGTVAPFTISDRQWNGDLEPKPEVSMRKITRKRILRQIYERPWPTLTAKGTKLVPVRLLRPKKSGSLFYAHEKCECCSRG